MKRVRRRSRGIPDVAHPVSVRGGCRRHLSVRVRQLRGTAVSPEDPVGPPPQATVAPRAQWPKAARWPQVRVVIQRATRWPPLDDAHHDVSGGL